MARLTAVEAVVGGTVAASHCGRKTSTPQLHRFLATRARADGGVEGCSRHGGSRGRGRVKVVDSCPVRWLDRSSPSSSPVAFL